MDDLIICDFQFAIYDCQMTKQQVLDLYFLDARHKLIEIAAFLDRVERADGPDDFRLKAFRNALALLGGKKRAKNALLTFSDLTAEPVAKAEGKGAVGAAPKIKKEKGKRKKFSASAVTF
jgi:hypothetical protein